MNLKCMMFFVSFLFAVFSLIGGEKKIVLPVVNGGFEQDGGWGGSGVISDAESHSGRKSLLLTHGYAFQTAPTLIKISPGYDYKISVWIKTVDTEDSLAAITAICRGGKEKNSKELVGKWLPGNRSNFSYDPQYPAMLAVGNVPKWTCYEIGIPASQIDPQAKFLGIYLRYDASVKASGKVYFDDLTVEQLPKGSLKTQRQGPSNAVLNPGFEQGKLGWSGTGIDTTSKKTGAGSSSLKISNGYAMQGVALPKSKRIELKLKLKSVDCAPNSIYVQLSYRGPGVKGGWDGPVRNKIQRHTEPVVFSSGGTHAWREVSIVLAPPPKSEKVYLYLRESGLGTAYFDNVTIVASDKPVTTPRELRAMGLAPAKPMPEDTDFARPELVNANFANGLKGWLSDGHITPETKGGPRENAYLKMLSGSIMQGVIVKSKEYRKVTILVKTEAMGDASSSLEIQFRSRIRKIGRPERLISIGGNQDWKKLVGCVQVPPGATSMTIIIHKGFDDGVLNVASVKIEKVSGKVAESLEKQSAFSKLMARGGGTLDYSRIFASMQSLARQSTSRDIVLADHGMAKLKIYASSKQLTQTRELRIPKGCTLKSIDLRLLHAQQMSPSSIFHVIPLDVDLKKQALKSLLFSIEVKSKVNDQSYQLGVRLADKNGKLGGWLSGRYIRGGESWGICKNDLTARVLKEMGNGYVKISKMYLRAYRPKGNVAYLLKNVKLTLNGKNLYFNNFENGKKAFPRGGEIVSKTNSLAISRPILRISDGRNPLFFKIITPNASLSFSTEWSKPSSTIRLGLSNGWLLGISQITFSSPGKPDVRYAFDDIKKQGPVNGVHGGIGFGLKKWAFQAFSAPGGKNSSGIIRPFENENPNTMEFYAAREMSKYLGSISGAHFEPFANDGDPDSGPLLVIGRNNAVVDQLDPTIPYDKLGDEGFVIRSVGRHLIITGAKPRGTLYGVYWFLDHKLGVRWFSQNFTYIPRREHLSTSSINEVQVPRFNYRELFWKDGDDEAYRAHNLLNGKSHHRLAIRSILGLNSWSTDWSDGGHNFHKAVPNKSLHGGGQLAMMDNRVRANAATYLLKRLRNKKKGDFVWLGLGQEDHGWRPDAASLKFMKTHGGVESAPLMDMILNIAKRVRKKAPEAKLATMVYQWSLPAPTGIKIPDYIQLTVAPIRTDYSQPYNGPKNEYIKKMIEKWAKISDNIVIWDYSATNFAAYAQPHPTFDSEFESIQWLATIPSIKGYFGQGAMGSIGAEFGNLRQWVGARLLWNPKQDWRALVKEFVMGYYGDAGPYIMKYIDLMHDSKKKSGCKLQFKTPVTAPFLTFDTLKTADDLFNQAAKAVAGKVGFERRVATARIGVDSVILLRRGDYKYDAANEGVTWDPDTLNRLARLKINSELAGISLYGEGTGMMRDVLSNMKVERKRSQPLDIVKGLPPDEWLEVQDLGLKLMVKCNIVGDKLASDGGAVTMIGNTGAWGVQLTMDFLPAGGKWKLYVEVRVDPAESATDETHAIAFGVYPGPHIGLDMNSFKDGKYHVFAVPGVYESNAGQSLWFAPPNSKAIKAIYIDRVVAVKVSQ